jgi:hypothetical protein
LFPGKIFEHFEQGCPQYEKNENEQYRKIGACAWYEWVRKHKKKKVRFFFFIITIDVFLP